ncbi:Uncharacterised protein [Paenibacillus thiaminolyticus]|nr:Uncharacterised protein [Paenibacillus thiaminolyticus]
MRKRKLLFIASLLVFGAISMEHIVSYIDAPWITNF